MNAPMWLAERPGSGQALLNKQNREPVLCSTVWVAVAEALAEWFGLPLYGCDLLVQIAPLLARALRTRPASYNQAVGQEGSR